MAQCGLDGTSTASERRKLHELPGLLSPNLPKEIEEAIREAEIAAKVTATKNETADGTPVHSAPGSASIVTGDRLGVSAKDVAAKHVSPKPRNGFRAGTDSPGAHTPAHQEDSGEKRKAPPGVAAKRLPSPRSGGQEGTAGDRTAKVEREAKSRVVKLKYRRERRDTIRQILRLPPKRQKERPPLRPPSAEREAEPAAKKTVERPGTSVKRDTNVKGVAQKIGPPVKAKPAEKLPELKQEKRVEAELSTANKRPRAEDSESVEPTAKRKKPDAVEKVKEREAPARTPTSEPAQSSQPKPKKADAVKTLKRDASPQSTPKPRTHDKEEEPPRKAKRPEALTLKDPSTPIAPDQPTPSAVSSAQKSQQPTPSTARRDLLAPTTSSSGLKRDPSRDPSRDSTNPSSDRSNNTPTAGPSTSNTTTTTSNTSQPTNRAAAPPAPKPQTPTQKAWTTEQTRLQSLGRELKHSASAFNDSITASSAPEAAHRARTLAALTSLEALLAFLLAFSCADLAVAEGAPPPLKTWRSLQGFLPFVQKLTKGFPELGRFCASLGTVFNWHILRLASAKNGRGEAGRVLNGLEGVLDLVQAVEVLKGKSLKEAEWLVLWPEVWKGRTKEALDGKREVLEVPGSYKGAYEVPLVAGTEPVVAIRAGVAMLEEWVAKRGEGCGYVMKLKL